MLQNRTSPVVTGVIGVLGSISKLKKIKKQFLYSIASSRRDESVVNLKTGPARVQRNVSTGSHACRDGFAQCSNSEYLIAVRRYGALTFELFVSVRVRRGRAGGEECRDAYDSNNYYCACVIRLRGGVGVKKLRKTAAGGWKVDDDASAVIQIPAAGVSPAT